MQINSGYGVGVRRRPVQTGSPLYVAKLVVQLIPFFGAPLLQMQLAQNLKIPHFDDRNHLWEDVVWEWE